LQSRIDLGLHLLTEFQSMQYVTCILQLQVCLAGTNYEAVVVNKKCH